MKTILCYGDSNTWGWNPADRSRYGRDERWPGVLRQELGDGYVIIEEGLNGRTTVWDDPVEEGRNGKAYLYPCLETHRPIDLVILMLGTNDLKMKFSQSARDISLGIETLVKIIKKSGAGLQGNPPKILIMCPPTLGTLTEFKDSFEGWEKKCEKLPYYYKRVAEQYGCGFFDTSTIIASSDIDGIHLEKSEQEKLGKAAADIVREMLK